MTLKWHIITGAIGAAASYPYLGKWSAAFLAASVLIDADHYLDYVYHNGFRDFSVRRMFDYHALIVKYWHSADFISLEIFHTVEFMAALYIAAHISGSAVMTAVFIGCAFHIGLDMIYLGYHGIFFTRAHSMIEFLMRVRSMKAKGLNPSAPYEAAVKAAFGE